MAYCFSVHRFTRSRPLSQKRLSRKIIGVDHRERLMDRMQWRRAPRPVPQGLVRSAGALRSPRRNPFPVYIIGLIFLQFGSEPGLEIIGGEILADDEYPLQNQPDGIVDRIVHDGFTRGPETLHLFHTSITAGHAWQLISKALVASIKRIK